MSTTSETSLDNVIVDMLRDDLDNIPQFSLPPGYRFRPFRDGDDVTWTDLQTAGEPFLEVTPELFVREFEQHHDALYDRMFFVETEQGTPVATITAWWQRDKHANNVERSIIHWVLVHPDHRRRGLTKPMMTHAMARMAQDPYPTAMLGTSTGRTWAIKVYLDFGFYPHPLEMEAKPEVVAAWQILQRRLNHPLLAKWLPQEASMTMPRQSTDAVPDPSGRRHPGRGVGDGIGAPRGRLERSALVGQMPARRPRPDSATSLRLLCRGRGCHDHGLLPGQLRRLRPPRHRRGRSRGVDAPKRGAGVRGAGCVLGRAGTSRGTAAPAGRGVGGTVWRGVGRWFRISWGIWLDGRRTHGVASAPAGGVGRLPVRTCLPARRSRRCWKPRHWCGCWASSRTPRPG